MKTIVIILLVYASVFAPKTGAEFESQINNLIQGITFIHTSVT